LLEVVLPEVAAMRGVEQSPDYHPEGDVFEHTMRLLERLDRPSEALALAALLHDVAKKDCAARDGDRITFYGHTEVGAERAVEICRRLRRSRAVWEEVEYLVRSHLRHVSAPEMRKATLRRFLSEEHIDNLLELARIDALASSGDLTTYRFCMEQRSAIGAEQLRPAPLLRGRDLLDLGWRPGPRIGEILHAVEERQLDGELNSRDDAVEWVEHEFGAERE
jgi:poly(A) polymerase